MIYEVHGTRALAIALLALTFSGLFAARAAAQSTLQREPAPGLVRCGDVVFIDDHTCPRGQIKKITGGCDLGTRGNSNLPGRQRACVSRP